MAIPVLRQLYDIIGTSLSTIESVYSDAKETYPSLDSAYSPNSAAEKLVFHPDVAKATSLLASAAEQLTVSLKPPYTSLCDAAMAYHLPACLAYVERLNIVEALNTSGPKGMSVIELADMSGTNAVKLGMLRKNYLLTNPLIFLSVEQVLRLLATHYYFREVEPNRFANNRLSSLIDSEKPFQNLS